MNTPHIGTLKERSLHAALKERYAGSDGRLEVRLGNFVVDVQRRDGLLVEIQTGSFSSIRRKLEALTEAHELLLVHPVAAETWIVKVDEAGQALSRRKSPKRQTVFAAFAELSRVARLLRRPRLAVEIVLAQVDEHRRDDGKGSWRRRGQSIVDRRLLAVSEIVRLEGPSDYGALLPEDLEEPFGCAELAAALSHPLPLARAVTATLREVSAIRQIGKRGNALLYERSGSG